MNILILSAGTRCQLINYFRKKENGFDKVVSTDCSKYAPALYMSDKYYIVPKIESPSYLPTIKEICKKEDIQVLLPLQEDELELIARHNTAFQTMGVFTVISGISSIKLCHDKYCLYKHLTDEGIPCIDTYDYNTESDKICQLEMPVFIKEKHGAGSIGAFKINNPAMLKIYAECAEKDLIVQPYYDTDEFGVDAYIDFISGETIAIFAKKKIRMRAGETEKSISVKDTKLFDLTRSAIKSLDLRGPIDIDILWHDGEYHILEINPRFGGGYPHAYACGVNFIKYIYANAQGIANQPAIGKYNTGSVLLKYTDAIVKADEDLEVDNERTI